MTDSKQDTSQDQAELKAMADYYATQYGEVYFVSCLKCSRVIAVEAAPANESTSVVERALGKRNIFGYQGLLYTTRVRYDTNDAQQRMIGYQCKCGNDTRMSQHECGIVPVTTESEALIGGAASIRILSPFERSQLMAKVSQATAQTKSDYDVGVNENGNIAERFETFSVARVK